MNSLFQNLIFLEGDKTILQMKVNGRIGAGNSPVFEVEDITKNITYAMKENVIKDQQQYIMAQQEINLLQRLSDQQFVIKLIGYAICQQVPQNEFQDSQRIVFILMEKGHTSLAKFIEVQDQTQKYFEETLVLKLISRTIEGFALLQTQNIAHQDIKPENILLMDLDLDLKVCDIGSSLDLVDNFNTSHTIVGTLPFLAPEIIDQFPQRTTKVSAYKADVFSLGLCLLYFICFHKFQSRDRIKIGQAYKEIIKEWINLSNLLMGQNKIISKILSLALVFDPEKRVDFIELNEELKKVYFEVSFKPDVNLIKATSQQVSFTQSNEKAFNHYEVGQSLGSTKESIQPLKRQRSAMKQGQVEQPQNDQFNQNIIIGKLSERKTKQRQIKSKFSDQKLILPSNYKHQVNPSIVSESPKIMNTQQQHSQTMSLPKTRIIKGSKESPTQLNQILQQTQPDGKNEKMEKPIKKQQYSEKQILMNDHQDNKNTNSFLIFKHNDPNDLSQYQGTNQDVAIWFTRGQMNIQIDSIVQSVCSQERNILEIKVDQAVKFLQISSSFQNIKIKVLIIDIHQADNNFWSFLLELLNQMDVSLKFLEININSMPFDFSLLELIGKSLLKQTKLKSLIIRLCSVGEEQEKEHKKFAQQLQRLNSLENLLLDFRQNHLTLSQPQWCFNEKLRQLNLNYSSNQIGKSLNSLALTLAKLQVLEILQLDISKNESTQKDLNFLFSQFQKLSQLRELNFKCDQVSCITDQFVLSMVQQFLKIQSLQGLRLSLVGTNLEQTTLFECINTFEKLNIRQDSDSVFSIKLDRSVSKNEILRYNAQKKILQQFKIDFLTFNLEWVEVIYLKNKDFLYNNNRNYPQVCNKGFQITSSNLYVCLTCSDKFQLILQRPVVVCEFCALNCHTYKVKKFNDQIGQIKNNVPNKLTNQRHNFIISNDTSSQGCDCCILGKCKLSGENTCSESERRRLAYKCNDCFFGEQFLCQQCQKNCHQNHSISTYYPLIFKCECLNDHQQFEIQ